LSFFILLHYSFVNLSISCRAFGKNSGSFGFLRWLCVLAKPNVPECAVGFLHVAQLLICGINLLFIGLCFRITGTFVLVYHFNSNIMKNDDKETLNFFNPILNWSNNPWEIFS